MEHNEIISTKENWKHWNLRKMDGTRKYYAEQGNQGPWIEKKYTKVSHMWILLLSLDFCVYIGTSVCRS